MISVLFDTPQTKKTKSCLLDRQTFIIYLSRLNYHFWWYSMKIPLFILFLRISTKICLNIVCIICQAKIHWKVILISNFQWMKFQIQIQEIVLIQYKLLTFSYCHNKLNNNLSILVSYGKGRNQKTKKFRIRVHKHNTGMYNMEGQTSKYIGIKHTQNGKICSISDFYNQFFKLTWMYLSTPA